MITPRTIRRPKENKKKVNTRVDFTPMVDMMMLLLTFFMFCTTLSKPQIMDVAMPTKDASIEEPPNTIGSKAITLILASKNQLYYYEGVPNFEDYTSLKAINYTQLRGVIATKNAELVKRANKLNTQRKAKQISEADYKLAMSEVRKDKQGITAVIKPTKDAIYQNLVDALDEMAICSVGRYAVVDMTETDEFLIKNYESKGLYAQNGAE